MSSPLLSTSSSDAHAPQQSGKRRHRSRPTTRRGVTLRPIRRPTLRPRDPAAVQAAVQAAARPSLAQAIEGVAAGILFIALPFSVMAPSAHALPTELRIGLIFAVFGISLALGQTLAPRLRRHAGQLPFWAYLCAATTSLLYLGSPSLIQLLGARVLQGIALGIANPYILERVTQSVAVQKRGQRLGWHHSVKSLGLALGPVLGGVLIANGSVELAYLIALTLGWVASFCLGIDRSAQRATDSHSSDSLSLAKNAREEAHSTTPAERFASAVLPWAAFAAAGSATLLVVLQSHFVHELHLSAASLGLAFAIMILVRAVGSWPIGRLADRTSDRALMALGLFILAAALTWLGNAASATELVFSRAFMGLGMALFAIPCFARVSRLRRLKLRLSRFSSIGSGFALGVALGPLLSALMITVGNVTVPILFWGSLSLLFSTLLIANLVWQGTLRRSCSHLFLLRIDNSSTAT